MKSSDLPARLAPFAAAVRRNCHIADARYAREMTMCTYLLEMREFYRWERGLPYGASPPQAEVGAWLAEREALWEGLQGEGFAPLPLDGVEHDPYAVDAINEVLAPQELFYGAGIGRFGKPHFFIARLYRRAARNGARIFVCDDEYVRDMTTVPAASQGDAVIVRREALRRWLWEQAEAWDAKRSRGALQLAFDAYSAEADLAQGIERMVAAETDTLILHELGEHAAGRALGPGWEAMLVACRSRRAEVLVRAVRDNLADCASTLPALLDARMRGSLHFWFANFKGMRLALFPTLHAAYVRWREHGDDERLRRLVDAGRDHWLQVAKRLLDDFARRGPEFEAELERLSHEPGELSPAAPG
ncbi:MAG TPA: hypothetical protein VF816_12790 [Rhodocyclaceae bacterium]